MRVVEIGDNGLPKVHPWNGVSCQAVYIPATQYARVTPTVNVQAKLAAGVHTFGVLWWIVGSSVTVETDYIVMDGSGVGGGLSLIELG
jgi:hypothetical protein